MIRFKDDLNKELNFITCNTSPNELISKTKPKHNIYYYIPRVAAAVLVLVLLAGICFTPNLFSNQYNGFIIVANAQSLDDEGLDSAEEITAEKFVELKSIANTAMFYDFNYILNEDADDDNLVQKYLFHSFAKLLHIDVVGENIETISYKLSKGVICIQRVPSKDRYQYMHFDYSDAVTEFKFNYDERMDYQISFNPVNMLGADYDTIYAIREEDENGGTKVVEYVNEYPCSPNLIEEVGRGFKSSAPTVVTEKEIDALKSYIEAEDMVGFYNYRNKIFERLTNDITLDITVTKTDGNTETKTLQLRYNPAVYNGVDDNAHHLTGTISAKLIES
ncbi:MAG: hypothetical protein IJF52_07225 [Clostridia bacterium]|nr:hypothetical protein [Clostridia bacterium]